MRFGQQVTPALGVVASMLASASAWGAPAQAPRSADESAAPAQITDCQRRVFAGDELCVCGSFPSAETGAALTLDGEPLGQPLSASAGSVRLRIPQTTPPGPHQLGGLPQAGFAAGASCSTTVVAVRGEIDRRRLLRGESTPMRLWIEGTTESLTLRVTNHTPDIISLQGGNDQVMTTSGGSPNRAERTVHAVRPGDFEIRYTLAADACPCPEAPAATEGKPAEAAASAQPPTPERPAVSQPAAPAAPSAESGIAARSGQGLTFEVVLENLGVTPQSATLFDPVPAGCSHLVPGSVQVDGSSTPPRNSSTPAQGVRLTNLTVPPRAKVTVTYTFQVASGVPSGFPVANAVWVNGVLTAAHTETTVAAPQQPAAPLRVGKRPTGTTTTTGTPRPPAGHPTIPGGPEWPPIPPPDWPSTPPPELPPWTEFECDCCCYMVLVLSASQLEVASPAGGGGAKVPLGGALPLAVNGLDLDGLRIDCQKEVCGEEREECPVCESSKFLPLPGTLRYRWEVTSGEGGLRSKPPYPHPHSATAEGPAAVYVAPEVMPQNRTVKIRLTVDDSPEYLADIDDEPEMRNFTIEIVERDQPLVAPTSNRAPTPSHIVEPRPSDCSCQPDPQWAALEAIQPQDAGPTSFAACAGGSVALAAAGKDVDQLSARCKDPE
ncbi:MAG: hypothetical protein ACRD2T_10705, partial [Thermoanaerobaculia bacterium]